MSSRKDAAILLCLHMFKRNKKFAIPHISDIHKEYKDVDIILEYTLLLESRMPDIAFNRYNVIKNVIVFYFQTNNQTNKTIL